MTKIGGKIRELRKAKKMTQDGLARAIGKDRTLISKIEHDRVKNLPFDVMNSIVEALGGSVAIVSDGNVFRGGDKSVKA